VVFPFQLTPGVVCRRFRDPGPEELAALTKEGMMEVVRAQLYAENLEVNVVGDFDAQVCSQDPPPLLISLSYRPPHLVGAKVYATSPSKKVIEWSEFIPDFQSHQVGLGTLLAHCSRFSAKLSHLV